MATRFVHYILAVNELTNDKFTEEERLQFLIGAVLPDVTFFHLKKRTHFNRFRWRIGTDRALVDQALDRLPAKVRQGWELHLNLDKLWQNICFLPNLYRLPGLLLRYGRKIGKKYYEEISDFDLWVRERTSSEALKLGQTYLDALAHYNLPDHELIDNSRWPMFLDLLRDDFTKQPSYQGPPFVGEKSFSKFFRAGMAISANVLAGDKDKSPR